MALTKVTQTGASKENLKEGFATVNDIIDDLLSTSTGLGASCVGIEDSAGNFAAANVETALAEVYTDHANALTMSEVFDENSTTTTGLTWGYKGGLFRNDNTITTVADGTVSLNDDTTNYVEVGSDGVVYVVTGSFTSGRIPIRTVLTASGAQSTSTDKRAWFNAWPVAPDLVDKLKIGVNATVNILDLFEKTTGVVPTATYPIKVAIPDGTGVTWRTRSTAYLSGTAKFTLADATSYWSRADSATATYWAYVYAIWDGTGVVWALGSLPNHRIVTTTTTATDADYLLLEGSSTYTRSASHKCVLVGEVPYTYDTGDTPDHTFLSTGATYPQVKWGVPNLTAWDVLTAQGDILYASAANTLARLAKGSAGHSLLVNSGATAPEWTSLYPLITETTAAHTASAAELVRGTTYTSSYAGETIITLPAGAVTYRVRGIVTVAQYLQFLTNGSETIRFLATQGAAGGYVRSNVVGNTIEMVWSGTEWVITGLGGAWSYDE